jgi:N-acetylmannosamine-6-phosphate 2-epimerase / N-acetylmannosamine kinase
MTDLLQHLAGGLIVSCQPVPGGPFDAVEGVVAFARAAQASGARALRIEGAANVAAVVRECGLPVIGLIKRDMTTSKVRITPLLEDVAALADAGAAIIAVDVTARTRPVPVAALLQAVRARGRLAMADAATFAEARQAVEDGADLVGSTMSGYTGDGPVPTLPDLALVRALAGLGVPVMAEGRYNAPELAAQAIRAGATAVVVGSAITRPEHITTWFRAAVENAARASAPVLVYDIGGTKTLAALVRGREVLARRKVPTAPEVGAAGWPDGLAQLAAEWAGRYSAAAVAATGVVTDGRWSALNPGVLDIPRDYALQDRLSDALGVPVTAVNDAQAAAWGEYRHGAGQGRDLAFVTVSSGIGGGIVSGGRLLRGARGLAGSLGQVPWGGASLEARASGFAIAAAARSAGYAMDAPGVFAAARDGAGWAERILADAAAALAAALVGLQAVADPQCIVIGGGVGLAEGFLDRLRAALAGFPPVLVPDVVPAGLGADAGIVGAADLADGPREAARSRLSAASSPAGPDSATRPCSMT